MMIDEHQLLQKRKKIVLSHGFTAKCKGKDKNVIGKEHKTLLIDSKN